MRAILLRQPGGPEVLGLEDVPTPEPGPGEVRVRAQAIGVGRPDVLVRKGTYKWMPPLPAIPGTELAGTVDQLGAGADPALLGRRVLVSARELSLRGGCYAECICVPATAVFPLPDSIDAVDAVSLPNVQLALALFMDHRPSMQSMLVTGAAGAVAVSLAQVGRSKGMRVIGTASTAAKAAFAQANGFDDVLSLQSAPLAEQVMALTEGRGVDIGFDHLGGASLVQCLRSLAPFGVAVSYNVVTGPPTEEVFALQRALLGRSLAVRTFSMHALDASPSLRRQLMQDAVLLMAQGQVKAPPAQRFAMDQVQRAHALQEAGASLGKIVLLP